MTVSMAYLILKTGNWHLPSFSLVAIIAFEEDGYDVNEETGFITVNLTLVNTTLERDVSVDISTFAGSATGLNGINNFLLYHFVLYLGGVDFNITSNELIFTPIATQNGKVITIIDDTCVENNETFGVSLTTSDPVLFTSQSISVTILDIVDSEFSYRDSIHT